MEGGDLRAGTEPGRRLSQFAAPMGAATYRRDYDLRGPLPGSGGLWKYSSQAATSARLRPRSLISVRFTPGRRRWKLLGASALAPSFRAASPSARSAVINSAWWRSF